jgi:ADP-ribose pyrophosphatase YjhB (NUDIX family)
MLKNPYFTMTSDIVAKHFPGVRVRAGVLLIYNNKILLVEEKSGNFGPPKGMVNWNVDNSVLDAAFREVREEIGLNIKNKSARLCTNIYMYHREHHKELLVYYAVFIKYQPRIYVRKNEIVSFVWTPICEPLSGRFTFSESSTTIFRAIDNSILFRCVQTIPLQSNLSYGRRTDECNDRKKCDGKNCGDKNCDGKNCDSTNGSCKKIHKNRTDISIHTISSYKSTKRTSRKNRES